MPGVGVPNRPTTRSRRCVARWKRAVHRANLAHQCIIGLNDLSMYTSDYPSIIYPPNLQVKSSSLQSRVLTHISSCVSRYSRRLSDAISDRSDLSLGEFSTHCDVDYVDAVQALLPSAYMIGRTAVPLEADKVSLPEVAGAVDLLDFLPPAVRNCYSNSIHMMRPPHHVRPPHPMAKRRIPQGKSVC